MSKESLADSNLQETPVSNMLEPASKSIWKPISELPVNNYKDQQLIIRWDNNGESEIATYDTDENYFMSLDLASQYCDSELREWCELSDFINQQISLEERITKLENK